MQLETTYFEPLSSLLYTKQLWQKANVNEWNPGDQNHELNGKVKSLSMKSCLMPYAIENSSKRFQLDRQVKVILKIWDFALNYKCAVRILIHLLRFHHLKRFTCDNIILTLTLPCTLNSTTRWLYCDHVTSTNNKCRISW